MTTSAARSYYFSLYVIYGDVIDVGHCGLLIKDSFTNVISLALKVFFYNGSKLPTIVSIIFVEAYRTFNNFVIVLFDRVYD